MAPLAGFEFRRLLRAMDADAFERFVADAWRARGWTVKREAGLLVVEHPTLADRRTLDVRAVPWWRPGTPSPAPSDADLVVVNRPVPGEHPSVVDADDLHDLVRYAVDPEDRADLRRTHLDTSGSLSGWAVRRAPALADLRPAAVAVVLAVLLAAAAGVAFLPEERPAGGVQDGGAGLTPVEAVNSPGTPSEFAATRWPGGGGGYPSGVDADGVTDPAALAAAHVERAGSRPYELTLTVGKFEGGRLIGAYEERIAVRSDWTFASSVETEGDLGGDHPAFSAVEMYSAGNGVFVHVDSGRSMDRQAALRASPGDVAGLENRVERYLVAVLSLNESSVARTSQIGDTTLHRVNGSAVAADGTTESVSVLVTAGGTVHEVRSERDVPGADRSVVVTLEYTYGPVTVAPPPWLGNDSATVGRNLPLSKR